MNDDKRRHLAITLHGGPGPITLDADERDLLEIETIWAKLSAVADAPCGGPEHGIRKQPAAEWHAENIELAQKAKGGDYKALANLIRRDPRVLAQPFVIAKIVLWKMHALLAKENRSSRREKENSPLLAGCGGNGETAGTTEKRENPPVDGQTLTRSKSRSARGTEAVDNLDRIAQAIRFTVGSGRQGWTNPYSFAQDAAELSGRVDAALEEIRALRQPAESHAQRIASAVGLDEQFVLRMILNPRLREGIIQEILAADYGKVRSVGSCEDSRWAREQLRRACERRDEEHIAEEWEERERSGTAQTKRR